MLQCAGRINVVVRQYYRLVEYYYCTYNTIYYTQWYSYYIILYYDCGVWKLIIMFERLSFIMLNIICTPHMRYGCLLVSKTALF